MFPYDLPLVFKISREAQRIKQKALAGPAGVDNSAISKFEAGIPAIDQEKLLKIASGLSLDRDYILGKVTNPFKSDNLIKVLIPGLISSDTSFFDLLITHAKQIQFISLLPELNIIEAIANLGLPDIPISAVAAKDEKENIFLIRKLFRHDYVVRTNEVSLQNKLAKLLYLAGKDTYQITFRTLPIDKELTKKIKEWKHVEKQDIAPLFDRAKIISALFEMFKQIKPTGKEIKEALKQYNIYQKRQ